jgi:hypothetical protein
MASLDLDTTSRDTDFEKYDQKATDIVFSIPELSCAEQAAWLIRTVGSETDELTQAMAEEAIDLARRTF